MGTTTGDRANDGIAEKSHLDENVHADVDVLEVTTKRPYREVNFLMTYFAAGLGALASFGGFVMPATSLALINEDIGRGTVRGASTGSTLTCVARPIRKRCLGCACLDSVSVRGLYTCRSFF